MVSRCPSCGSPTKEDERLCPSCGWDFVARKRGGKPEARPPGVPPPSPAAPPETSGFALPPARNLNEPPVGQPTGLKPLPKLEPRASNQPAEDENPFTLPTARGATPPPEPPAKKAPPPEKPAPAPQKDGLGARLFRSLRGGPTPSAKEEASSAPPPEAPKKKGFSLPPARIIEPSEEPAAPPRRTREDAGPEKPVPEERPEPAPRVEREPERPRRPVEPDRREDKEKPPAAAPEAAKRYVYKEDPLPEPAESLLPSSAREPAPPAPSRRAPPPPPPPRAPDPEAGAAAKAADARKSLVMIAAVAGAALGTVSVLAVYLLMRPDTTPGSNRGVVSPFERAAAPPAARPDFPAPPAPPAAAPQQSPAPVIEAPVPASKPIAVPVPRVAPPAPAPSAVPALAPAPAASPVPAPDPSRPAASFSSTPRLVVTGEDEPKPAAARKPAATPKPVPPEERKPRKPKGPRWVFEGDVFDLLTTRGVFGARLMLLDPDGNVVGETDSGPAGRYKLSVPAGSGYKLKISHGDYTDRYIDEGDATSSLRDATPDERRMLMSAAARNLPWTGDPAKPVHRDLALVPRTPEEP